MSRMINSGMDAVSARMVRARVMGLEKALQVDPIFRAKAMAVMTALYGQKEGFNAYAALLEDAKEFHESEGEDLLDTSSGEQRSSSSDEQY